uniref:Caspase-8 n=1 Tax=Neogobius melanostomus TaxID=47308 RepID=A0A8C6UF69_9GOBI
MFHINIIRRNKTALLDILSVDRRRILQKVQEHNLITNREYRNLNGIYKEDEEGHIVELLDKIMGKGDETCQHFLDLLETDDIKGTYPELKSLQLRHTSPAVTAPVQETCDEPYPVNTIPRGICLILNNINFENNELKKRRGSEKDAESLGEVFSWLGLRVLIDISELQKLSLKEWSNGFGDLQKPPPKHGDVFICCILSHGKKEVVFGTDKKTIPIKDVTRTFKSSNNSPLTGKPKIFLIQACQGNDYQRGVVEKDLETDEGSVGSVPEEADVLVAIATVENCASFRNTAKGSWFIQSLCQQLREGCSRGDDIHSILQCVNSDVSQKEGSNLPGLIKQMPEIRYTLRKKLLLSPFNTEA